MCQALGLYELCQHGVTCVQAPRCHHTAIPQCFAPTHSKKKNPLREKTISSIKHVNYSRKQRFFGFRKTGCAST